jgi:hypothetical protein
MVYEIPLVSRVYVSLEHGGEAAACRLVRDLVANDWLLRETEGSALDAGHYVVKGLSGEVGTCRPFRGNQRVMKAQEEEA